METNHKKYFRAKELSELLGIGLSTVWLYAKQGKLTPKKISERVTVFHVDEINRLFDEVA
jgi:predicted DNA-binding transcriptional regulator AlpA